MSETIQRNGYIVSGFALGGEKQFMAAFEGAIKIVDKLRTTLSPREKLILELGLAASHLEESIVLGHTTRARAHAENVAKLLDQIGIK